MPLLLSPRTTGEDGRRGYCYLDMDGAHPSRVQSVYNMLYIKEVLIRIVGGISIPRGGEGEDIFVRRNNRKSRVGGTLGGASLSHEGIDVLRRRILVGSSDFSEFIHFHRKTSGKRYVIRRCGVSPTLFR